MRHGTLHDIFTMLAIALVNLAASPSQLARAAAPSDDDLLDMLPGVVEAAEEVTLATPFDGLLMQVNVAPGQQIEPGAVVAIMDDRVARAAVRVAEQSAGNRSEVELTQLQLAAANREAERFQQAHTQNVASGMERDRALATASQAAAQHRKALEQQGYLAAQLDLARAKLDEHRICAPFRGRVIRVEARPGQSLNRAEPIVTVANLQRLQVDLQVPVALFGQLVVGNNYGLYADAPVNRQVEAQLVHMEPLIDAATRTFRCRFEIENNDESLPAGFTARLIAPKSLRILLDHATVQ